MKGFLFTLHSSFQIVILPVQCTPAALALSHSARPIGRARQSKRANSFPIQLSWSRYIGPEDNPNMRLVSKDIAMEKPTVMTSTVNLYYINY